jgi:hypothetical protein
MALSTAVTRVADTSVPVALAVSAVVAADRGFDQARVAGIDEREVQVVARVRRREFHL